MATTFETPEKADRERRFFLILTTIITVAIVAGFSVNLGMGRSTFAVPLPYHLHAVIFFTWVVLFFTQNVLITKNQIGLHRTLGMVSIVWVPMMVVAAIYLMFVVMQRTGGPFFFAQNVFFFSNLTELLCFAGLTFAGLRARRHTGWHRRLMLCGFALLSNPGLGRLLPLPLLIPYAWHIMVLVVLAFPIAGMIRDKAKLGHVHPAWWWGVGAIVASQIVADLVAMSGFGIGIVEQLVAGTPGGERPMEAFLPPGFSL